MIVYQAPRVAEHVPVIDLGASRGFLLEDKIRAAMEIRAAARDIGFFYVINHGVPQGLVDDELAAARQFFEQPLADKMKIDIAQSKIMRGYEPVGLQTLDEGSPADLKESLMIGLENEGPNQWPPALPGFQEQANAYLGGVIDLGRYLGELIALSLELPGDYFADALAEPSCTTRMLRYAPQSMLKDNQIGCGAHTDWGFITILLQDDVGGLEVQNIAGDWIIARPVPGAFVVNLGDMIPPITNGLYRSTPHRVLNNLSGRDRYSVASFFNPNTDARISCAPTCLPDDGEAPPDFSAGEHVKRMFEKTYAKQAS